MHPANSRRSYDSYPNEIPRKTLIDEAIQEQLLDEFPYRHMPHRNKQSHEEYWQRYFGGGYRPMGESITPTHGVFKLRIPKGDPEYRCIIYEHIESLYSLYPRWKYIASFPQEYTVQSLDLKIGTFYCRASWINGQYKVQKFVVRQGYIEMREWLQH